jgi:hypothetical protein
LIKEINKQLPSLSEKELKNLKDKIDFLLKDTVCVNKESSTEHLLYNAISSNLLKKTRDKLMPFGVFRKRVNYKRFKEMHKFLDEMFEDVISSVNNLKSKKAYKEKWYQLFCTILFKNLEDWDFTIDIQSILNNFGRFPGLLNKEFPGYSEAGILFKLLEKDKKIGR